MSDWKCVNLERLHSQLPTDGGWHEVYVEDRSYEIKYICSIKDVNLYTTSIGRTLFYYGETFDDLLFKQKCNRAFLLYSPSKNYCVVKKIIDQFYRKDGKGYISPFTYTISYKIEYCSEKLLSARLQGDATSEEKIFGENMLYVCYNNGETCIIDPSMHNKYLN